GAADLGIPRRVKLSTDWYKLIAASRTSPARLCPSSCNAIARVNAARAIELMLLETDARLRQPNCTAPSRRNYDRHRSTRCTRPACLISRRSMPSPNDALGRVWTEYI